MDAYNYFKSGNVREVRVFRLCTTQSCVVMHYSKLVVNPSQHSPEKATHSWLGVKFDGTIITAHCTCVAG